MKPFRDSDQEVTIKWFPCAPGAKSLRRESLIMNDVWDYTPWENTTKGSQPVGEWVNNFAKPVVGARADHICGTDEDFANGCVRDETNNVRYAGNGLPLCCGVVIAGRGGGASGGVSKPSVVPYRDRMTGGVELGGAFAEGIITEDFQEGGIELGGEIRETIVFTDEMDGGVELGGEIRETLGYADEMDGGVELGGEWVDSGGSPVTPSNSCSTAPLASLGVATAFSSANIFDQRWIFFPIVVGLTYRVRVTSSTGSGRAQGGVLTTCSSTPVQNFVDGDGCFEVNAGVALFGFVIFASTGGSPSSASVTVTVGNCP